MTPEEKSLLERTYKMTEENNSILKKMRRASRISTAIRVVYWLVIVGLGFGAYFALQPYIDSTMNIINDGQKALEQLIPSSKITI